MPNESRRKAAQMCGIPAGFPYGAEPPPQTRVTAVFQALQLDLVLLLQALLLYALLFGCLLGITLSC